MCGRNIASCNSIGGFVEQVCLCWRQMMMASVIAAHQHRTRKRTICASAQNANVMQFNKTHITPCSLLFFLIHRHKYEQGWRYAKSLVSTPPIMFFLWFLCTYYISNGDIRRSVSHSSAECWESSVWMTPFSFIWCRNVKTVIVIGKTHFCTSKLSLYIYHPRN